MPVDHLTSDIPLLYETCCGSFPGFLKVKPDFYFQFGYMIGYERYDLDKVETNCFYFSDRGRDDILIFK